MENTIGDTKVNFHVDTEHFQGPIDLLLSLVEKRKLFINDFSLAKVADDYISQVRSFESYPIDDVANFLLIASTLVLIKSKSILPDLNLTKEEEEDIDDLKKRLMLYDLFKTLAETVKITYGKNIIFEKSSRTTPLQLFAPDTQMTKEGMAESATRIINALPKKQIIPKATIRKVISIEEMMTKLSERVAGTLRMGFNKFANYKRGEKVEREERVNVIISFLAMLELVKQGIVTVSQSKDFDDIDIEPIELNIPTYG